MTKRYYFSGTFSTRASGCIETEEELTSEEIAEYIDSVYDIDWDYGRKGEITDVDFEEVEDIE